MLAGWYPGSDLDMDEARRAPKRTRFGSLKYVYTPDANDPDPLPNTVTVSADGVF